MDVAKQHGKRFAAMHAWPFLRQAGSNYSQVFLLQWSSAHVYVHCVAREIANRARVPVAELQRKPGAHIWCELK